MAFQAVPDTVEIGIIYAFNAQIVQNVFYAEAPGGYVLGDLVALAAQIDGQVQGTWKAQQPPEAIYLRTEVRGLSVVNDLIASDNTNTGPGVFPATTLPNNVTIAVKKESGLTGRSARGRTYWIGIPFDRLVVANENLLDAAYLNDVVAAVDSIRTAIALVAPWVPVLVSRFTGGAARPTGVTFSWVTTSSVDNTIDTMRPRLPS